MLPGFDLINFAHTAGPITAILVVAAIVFAESGLFIGFFLPGDSVIFTLGFLLQTMNLGGFVPNINLVVLLLFVAAVLGDNVGYLSGRKIGPHLFKRPNSLLFRQENVVKAQEFYDKNGPKTIIIARFIPVVRTFAPIIAGVAKMKYKVFLTFNMIGGFLWTAGVTYLGYFLGAYLTKLGVKVDAVLPLIVLFILFISVSPALYHLLKDKKQRTAIWNATKLQIKKLVVTNKK